MADPEDIESQRSTFELGESHAEAVTKNFRPFCHVERKLAQQLAHKASLGRRYLGQDDLVDGGALAAAVDKLMADMDEHRASPDHNGDQSEVHETLFLNGMLGFLRDRYRSVYKEPLYWTYGDWGWEPTRHSPYDSRDIGPVGKQKGVGKADGAQGRVGPRDWWLMVGTRIRDDMACLEGTLPGEEGGEMPAALKEFLGCLRKSYTEFREGMASDINEYYRRRGRRGVVKCMFWVDDRKVVRKAEDRRVRDPRWLPAVQYDEEQRRLRREGEDIVGGPLPVGPLTEVGVRSLADQSV